MGQSSSNDKIERAIRSFKDQLRTLKDSLEFKLGGELPPDSHALSWLVRWAGLSLSLYCWEGQQNPLQETEVGATGSA